MEDDNQNPITLEGLANAYQQIQALFDNNQRQFTGLRNELTTTRNELVATHGNLMTTQSSGGVSLKTKEPEPFTGKVSVQSWII